MNASPSQPHPAEWQETQELLPAVERDLPAGRHQFHRERLMSQIHDELRTTDTDSAPLPKRRSPFRRPAIILPLAACALTGAVVTGVGLPGAWGGDEGMPTGPLLTTDIATARAQGTPRLLTRIAQSAQDTSPPPVRQDQYLYIKSVGAETYVKQGIFSNEVVSEKLHPRQTWMSPDGKKGWLIEPGNTGERGVTLNGDVPDTGAYNRLVKLHTKPDVLLKKIYKDTKGQGNGPHQQAFETIGDLLTESYPPAKLTTALYKAAAKIPGVVTVDDAVDAAGRHGIAVARLDKSSGQRTEWIFDKEKLTFLGDRTVQVESSSNQGGLIKPGTVVFTSAITQRAVVDDKKQTPSQNG